MTDTGRREVIVLGGAVCTSVLAGCLAEETDTGDEDSGTGNETNSSDAGESTVEFPTDPAFSELFEWIPAAAIERPLLVEIFMPAAMADIEAFATGPGSDEIYETTALEYNYVSYMESEGTETELVVLSGPVEMESAAESIAEAEDADLTETEAPEPFEEAVADDEILFAIAKGGAVVATPADRFEPAVETRTGEGQSVAEEEEVSLLTEHLPAGEMGTISLPDDDVDELAIGISYEVAEPDSAATVVAVYSDKSAAAENEDNAVEFAKREGVKVDETTINEQSVIVTGTQPTAELFDEPVDEVAPAVAFEFDYEPDSSRVEVRHVGGDTVQAGSTRVEGTGIKEGYTGYLHELTGSPFEADETVVAGTYFEVGVESNEFELEIRWESSETGDEFTVAQFDGLESSA